MQRTDENKEILLESNKKALMEAIFNEANEDVQIETVKKLQDFSINNKGALIEITINAKKYTLVSESAFTTLKKQMDKMTEKLEKDNMSADRKVRALHEHATKAIALAERAHHKAESFENQNNELKKQIQMLNREIAKLTENLK